MTDLISREAAIAWHIERRDEAKAYANGCRATDEETACRYLEEAILHSEAINALRALPTQAPVVKVKPLAWVYSETTYTADRGTGRQEASGLFWQASTILLLGGYTIMKLADPRFKGDRESYRIDIRGIEQRLTTLAAAKAAAQADYEARILAAIEPAQGGEAKNIHGGCNEH